MKRKFKVLSFILVMALFIMSYIDEAFSLIPSIFQRYILSDA